MLVLVHVSSTNTSCAGSNMPCCRIQRWRARVISARFCSAAYKVFFKANVPCTFYDKGLEGASHHAVIPNVNTIDKLREVWPRLSSDEKKLFDVIARAYLSALMPDFRFCNGPRLVNPSCVTQSPNSRFCPGSARSRHLMGFECG